MRSTSIGIAASLCLALSLCANAKDKDHETVEFSPTRFEEQRELIIEGLRSKTYAELSDEARAQVLDALNRMAEKLEGISSFAEMDKRDQTAVFNDQELINNLLTDAAADSRLICKREKFVGSHRTTNVCLTVAERRRLAEAAQEQMRTLQSGSGLEPDNR